MSIQRDRARRLIILKQERHIEKIVEASGLDAAWPTSIPMIPSVYRDSQGAPLVEPSAITEYKSLLGALMHISNYTRPDIAFAVSYLARFVNAVTTDKYARVVDIIKYLKGTSSFGLYLGGTTAECPVYAYCDADWAACPKTRKSVGGFVIMCGSGIGAISWKSGRQATVSRSSTESEYIAAGEVAKELQYLHHLTPQLGVKPACIPEGCDNDAAMILVEDPISAARTKHIDIIHHHVRQRVQMQQMNFNGIPTREKGHVQEGWTMWRRKPGFDVCSARGGRVHLVVARLYAVAVSCTCSHTAECILPVIVSTTAAATKLSLIHISEPTRPY